MGWLDKIKAAIGQTKDPQAELERAPEAGRDGSAQARRADEGADAAGERPALSATLPTSIAPAAGRHGPSRR